MPVVQAVLLFAAVLVSTAGCTIFDCRSPECLRQTVRSQGWDYVVDFRQSEVAKRFGPIDEDSIRAHLRANDLCRRIVVTESSSIE